MNGTSITAEEVLAVLDRYLRADAWPPAPNFVTVPEEWDIADQRLIVFRNNQHWIITIEIVETVGQSIFAHTTYLFSNCLQKEYCTITKEIASFSTDEEYDACVSVHHIRLPIEGQIVELFPTDKEYQSFGLRLPTRGYYAEKRQLPPWLLLRYLCLKLNHPFFSSEAGLRALIRQYAVDDRLADELRLFFQTSLWEHPNLFAGQTASDTASFRVLAAMIASGDTSLWQQQDTSRFNSCWRYNDTED